MKIYILLAALLTRSAYAGTGSFQIKNEQFQALKPLEDLRRLKQISTNLYCKTYDPAVEGAYLDYTATMEVDLKAERVYMQGGMNMKIYRYEKESGGFIHHGVWQPTGLIPAQETKFEIRADFEHRLVLMRTAVGDVDKLDSAVIHVCNEAAMF